MNQIANATRERGGTPLHDYTQGDGSTSLLSRIRTNGFSRGMGQTNFDKVGRYLGLVGFGLGLAETLFPKRILKLFGIRGDYSWLIRFMGMREISNTLLIAMQARPHQGIWARVAGDAMDLSVLGAAYTDQCAKKDRLSIATASIAGITAMDVLTATQINRVKADEKRYSMLTSSDLNGKAKDGAFHVRKSITIDRPPEELYQFWRNFENLPQFMFHLESVKVMDGKRSHWVAKAPAGEQVEWDAEITDDRPNKLIAWKSSKKTIVPNSGQVRFEPAPEGRGTIVQVQMEYSQPGGAIGRMFAKAFGEEPSQQVADDLVRFKQVMETGEVIRSDGSPEGYGQKTQRPAQPMNGHERSM